MRYVYWILVVVNVAEMIMDAVGIQDLSIVKGEPW
jgi:hypothetical protein